MLVLAGVLSYSRSAHTQTLEGRHAMALRRVETENRLQWRSFLAYDLLNLLVMFGSALFEQDPATRQMNVLNARNRTIWMAANVVGKTKTQGTRACLYRFNPERTRLEPEELGFAGRGQPCTRTYSECDGTFDAIKRGNLVYEARLDDDVVKAENLSYRTFIAHPVSIGIGPEFPIYGALMVDCPHEGDLDDIVDIAKVAVLSALIAATYIALDQHPRGHS